MELYDDDNYNYETGNSEFKPCHCAHCESEGWYAQTIACTYYVYPGDPGGESVISNVRPHPPIWPHYIDHH